tara:strand:- start:279 stop:7013 length:6735 start_codon:yes stop_codon:yes gene_type:complete
MATVYDYLRKLKEENPQYKYLSNRALYNQLKGSDPNLPIWKASSTRKYNKQDPSFLNGLFDWTDYGINETSARFAKNAYNNSITGLAYQLHNGQARFDLSDYNPGIVEDVFSAVLSFAMPLDIAAMFVGGHAGKALTGPMNAGIKSKMVNKLTNKKTFAKTFGRNAAAQNASVESRKELAERYVNSFIQDSGIASLYSKSQAIKRGAIVQGATLATFEGVRGGFQAAVDGDDIWEGIGHGVLHGGVMGALTGAVGASLNIKHGELLAKYGGDEVLSFSKSVERKLKKVGTGIPGQIAAEAGIFTAPEIKNVIEDPNYGMRELMRSFATNVGMMGVLKAKGKLWNKGKEEIGKWAEKEGLFEYLESKDFMKGLEKTKEAAEALPEKTSAERTIKKQVLDQLSTFKQNQLKKHELKIEDYENWEKEFDRATDIIQEKSKVGKVSPDDVALIIRQIQKVRGSMELNKKRGVVADKSIPKEQRDLALKEREAEIAELKKLEKQWKEEIEDKLDNFEGGISPQVVAQKNTRVGWKKSMEDAIKNNRKEQQKELREGLEEAVNEKGQIIDQAKFDKLSEKAEINRQAYESAYGEKPISGTVSYEQAAKKEAAETFEKKVDGLKELPLDSKAEPDVFKKQKQLKNADERVQNKEYENPVGDTTLEQIGAYNQSKRILKYFARKFLPESSGGNKGTQLGHAEKLADMLAKDRRSLFELTDADVRFFMETYTGVPRASVSKILKSLAEIANIKKQKGRELFVEELTYIYEADIGRKVGDIARNIKKKGGATGARIEAQGKPTKYAVNGKITMPSKTGLIEKFTSIDLIKDIKSLAAKVVRKITRSGHENYLFKVKDTKTGEYVAIQIHEVNAIVRELFGQKTLPKQAGEGRLFRKAISQWAAEKYGKNSAEAELVFQHITGHGAGVKNVKQTYEASFSKAEIPGAVNRVLNAFLKDVMNPKSKNFGKGKEGYATHEIGEGLRELNRRIKTKGDNVFTYKDGKQTKTITIDNKTLKTMVDYMIQTGPRLNEVGIDKSIFKTIEDMQSKHQLESKIKKADRLVDKQTLADQVKWVKQKFPQLSVQIEKSLGKLNGQFVLGKIQGHLIKIAQGKARIDTLPHEVSHHVVDVLRAAGDPISKRLIKDGIKLFKKKGMNEAQAEEALVESLGKYVAKELPKGKIGRMKSWVKRAVSYLRNYFNIRDKNDILGIKKDIVRIIGGKVVRGKIPTEYLDASGRLEVKHQTESTSKGKSVIKQLRKSIKNLKEEAEIYDVDSKILKSIEKDILGEGRTIESKDVNGYELEQIQKNYKTTYEQIVKDKSPEYAANYSKVKELEAEYGISESQRNTYFERFNKTFEKATPEMIIAYKSYITMGDKIKPLQNTVSDAFNQMKESNISGTLPLWKSAFFKSADVIRRFSPPIARKLELHDFTRSFEMKGPGAEQVEIIKKIVKDKKVRNNYMHFIDPELSKNAINQLKELSQDKSLTPVQRNKFASEYAEALTIKKSFEKGGEYHEATKRWKELSDFYWDKLLNAIEVNTPSKTEFKQLKDGLNEKYIQNYFVRRPTREVAEYLNENHSSIQKLIKNAVKDLTKEDLRKIKKSKTFESVEDAVAADIMNMLRYGPTNAKPRFLKKRGVTLPEYIKIPDKKGGTKLVKSYESDVDATMSTYVNGMSKFIATVKHFPEFTELGGKFSLKNKSSRAIVDRLAEGKGGADAIYAYETMKKQLGLDHNLIDVLNQPVSEIIGKITNISAVIGLSSPLAGVKNFLMQVPRSVAVFGVKNTYKGFTKAMRAMQSTNSMEWLAAVKRGETGYGQKELLFGADKRIKWWFENVNLMEKTENLNRIMTAEAGRLHFAELVSAYKGEGSGFFPKAKSAEINRMFTDIFRLSDKQIKHIKETKDLHNSVEYENILNYVGFSAHKSSAGATGVSDLPLWMSSKYWKPLTLFQRMAYSVTIDSYKNYIQPLKNKNPAPLIKATLGHMATGAALYAIYDWAFDQQMPDEENSSLDKALSYIWRGELLGVFGEAISPYRRTGNVNPLMEPVIIRNIQQASQEVLNVWSHGKPLDMALKDFARQTIVIGAQAEKAWKKSTNPFAVKVKRISTLERQWRKEMGDGYETTSGGVLKERHYAYRRLRNALMMNYSSEDVAKAYYSAYNTIMDERVNGGYVDMNENIKYTEKAIMSMIQKMNPLDISTETKGRITSRRAEFLNYLSLDNRALAENLEREYQYKVRQFERIIRTHKFKKMFANHMSYR